MLARRFIIVCLLVTIFGMFFASLVAQAGRKERGWQAQAGAACLLDRWTCGRRR